MDVAGARPGKVCDELRVQRINGDLQRRGGIGRHGDYGARCALGVGVKA